jgi:hypothetical protein
MSTGKSAASLLLLLVVAAAVVVGSASGSGSLCTPQEKDRLLNVCSVCIRRGAPAGWIVEACCRMALEKQAATNYKWLSCVVGLLTAKDKQQYDPTRIIALQTKCPPLGPTPAGI